MCGCVDSGWVLAGCVDSGCDDSVYLFKIFHNVSLNCVLSRKIKAWGAIFVDISVVLVPDNYLARADNIWSGTR